MLVYWQLYSGQLQSNQFISLWRFSVPLWFTTLINSFHPPFCVQGLFCVGSLKQYCGQIDGINFAYLLLRLLIYWCLQKEGLFLFILGCVRFLVRKFQQQRGFLISFSEEIIVVKERYICVLLLSFCSFPARILQFTSCSAFSKLYFTMSLLSESFYLFQLKFFSCDLLWKV